MKNQDFINKYIPHLGDKSVKNKENGSLLFRNGVLYSYGYHYPLTFKMGSMRFVNTRGYSNTTSRHISMCKSISTYNVNLTDRYIDKTSILKYLEYEQNQLDDDLSNLSARAWKQREEKQARRTKITQTISNLLNQ